jgi:hypothetical protein
MASALAELGKQLVPVVDRPQIIHLAIDQCILLLTGLSN